MLKISVIYKIVLVLLLGCASTYAEGNWPAIRKLIGSCHRNDPNFDSCMKRVFNALRPYFKGGAPEAGIPSFDPHFAELVTQKRGTDNLNYHLSLKNVREFGWTISKVTNFKSDWRNNRIIYTQYFPEKALEGLYELKANVLGTVVTRKGNWNITLYDYTQTTTITRSPFPDSNGGKDITVKVEIDRIGDMKLYVANKINGVSAIESFIDNIINAAWKPGFAVIRPLINDLVSTAFTKIWGDAFRHFPFEQLIPE